MVAAPPAVVCFVLVLLVWTIPTTSAQTLQRANLDFLTNTLDLYFSAPVLVGTSDTTKVFLQSDATADAETLTYFLESSPAYNPLQPTSVVNIPLSRHDVNRMKATPGLATNKANAFVGLQSDAFGNSAGVSVTPVLASKATPISVFVADSAFPQLDTFTLDMNAGTVAFVFSETVNLTSLDWTRFQFTTRNGSTALLQGPAPPLWRCLGLSAGDQRGSGGGGGGDVYAAELVLALSADTLNVMKANPPFGTNAVSTYVATSANLFLLEAFVKDMNNNVLKEVSGLQAASVVGDTTDPALETFDLDLYRQRMTLTFSEAVNVTSFDLSQLTLVDTDTATAATESFQFTADSSVARKSGSLTAVEIDIGSTDAATLRGFSQLGKSASKTILLTDVGVVKDMVGRSTPAIAEGAGLPVRKLILTGIVAFDMNMATDAMTLTFSDGILQCDVTSLVLQSSSTITDPKVNAYFRLTDNSAATVDGNDPSTVVILLGETDRNAIKRLGTLAIGSSSTFITTLDGTFTDRQGYFVSPVMGLQVATSGHTADNARPVVKEFTLDLNRHLLHITFSETVAWRSFDSSQVTLQQRRTLDGGERLTFEKASGLVPRADHISYPLFPQEQQTATTTTAATLTTAALCLNSATSVLRGLQTIDPTIPYLFETAVPLEALVSNTLTMYITDADITRLKQRLRLATSYARSWLVVTAETVTDMAGNQLQPLQDGSAIFGELLPDQTAPQLMSWGVDMNAGTLEMLFSEVITADSVDVTEVVLRSSPGDSPSYRLTELSRVIVPEVPSRTVTLHFGEDQTMIELNPSIATERSDTWLTFTLCEKEDACLQTPRSNVTDRAGNHFGSSNLVTKRSNSKFYSGVPWAAPIKADFFVPSAQRPRIVSFDLDLNSAQMTLIFSRPIIAQSINTTHLSLQDRSERRNNGEMFTFSANTVPSNQATAVVVTLNIHQEDVNALKGFTSLAKSKATTFLTCSSGFAQNTWYLPVHTIADASVKGMMPLQVNELIADISAVTLNWYYVDFTSSPATVKFVFSEPVDVERIFWEQFQLYNENDATSETTTTLSTPTNVAYHSNSPIVTMTMDVAADAYIRTKFTRHTTHRFGRFLEIERSFPTLFLSVDASAIRDVSGNPFEPTRLQAATLPVCGDCSAGFFRSEGCTTFEDRVCRPCTTCEEDHYQRQQCSGTEDATCTRCTECPFNMFQAIACEGDHDRTCTRCRACLRDEFETQACEFGLERVCVSCNSCALTPTQEQLCSHSSLSWRKQNCYFDTDGAPIIQENVNLNQFYITQRDSRRNEVFCQHANWDTLKIEKTDLNFFKDNCNVKPAKWVDEMYEEQYIEVAVPNPRVHAPGTIQGYGEAIPSLDKVPQSRGFGKSR
jgi:hypothetical protein